MLACCILAAAVALGISLLQTKMYTATASLLFREPGFSSELFGGTTTGTPATDAREAATNLNLVRLVAVDELAANALGGEYTGDELREKLSISSENESNVVSIAATDSDPEVASEIANTFAETYETFRRQADRRKVANAVTLVQKRLARLTKGERRSPIGESLANQASRLQTLKSLQTGNAELVQRATVPTSASSPKPVRNTVAAGIIGLLVGFAIAVLLERADRRLRRPDDFVAAFGIPLLTAVPESAALEETAQQPGAGGKPLGMQELQAFQMLRTRLRYFNVDKEVKVVMITSSSPGDGKSTTAWETASTAALLGTKALLIEAEFHRPTVASRHKLRPSPGLSELLTRQSEREGVTQSLTITDAFGHSNPLEVITAGTRPPNPTELVESQQMKQLLDAVREEYELVVLDAPPALLAPDAIPLTRLVDGVVVVGRVDHTTRDEARRLMDQLSKLGAPTLGVVANRLSRRKSGGYGYYGYYGDAPEAGEDDSGKNGSYSSAADRK
jgi:succinoglycan biosynthesis transport protein ExoP